jgi:xylulokinase
MAPSKEILIGIDVGTSATKVVAFNLSGKALASAGRDYPLSMPRPGWSEQDPDDWWKATVACLRAICKKIDPSRVSGVSFSGQMHGSVFLDGKNQVIRPCLLWNDARTAAQCDEIVRTLGRDKLLEVIKNLPLTSFTLPKILWLRQHEKPRFRRLRTVLLPKDYVRFRLTGVKCMDEADGAGTVMMEVGKKRWAVDLLSRLDLDLSILPPLTHSTDIVGRVTPEAARATGLRVDTLVVAGGGDQPVGATGVGVFEEGQAMVSLGTSGVVFAPTRTAHQAGEGGLASFDHAVPGISYLMGCVISAGGALQWYRNTLCPEEVAEARRRRVDPYDLILAPAAKLPSGAEDLLFLPYLMGERTPHPDPYARGVFFGLSGRHTRHHMTRALLEGVTFALRDCLELIQAKGVKIRRIRATGGGARSPFWLQLMANVFNLPVTRIENPEGGASGAAILAGVGTGAYKDFADAAARAIRTGAAVRPAAAQVRQYQPLYDRYRALYPALKDRFPRA